MHAINITTSDCRPICLFSSGCKQLECVVNKIFRDNASIISIIPLNHLDSLAIYPFRVICQDLETLEMLEYNCNLNILDTLRSRRDIAILRVFPN